MREIEFRGKITENGEWVYGFFENNKFQNVIHSIEEPFRRSYYINPKSLGQYTGLKDKNGRKIYEGDIIRQLVGEKQKTIGNIIWNGWQYVITQVVSGKETTNYFGYNSEDVEPDKLEVVGNIYENPELIKS